MAVIMNVSAASFWFWIPEAWRIAFLSAVICYFAFFLFNKLEKPFLKILMNFKILLLILLHYCFRLLFYILDFLVMGIYKVAPIKSKQVIHSYEEITRWITRSVNASKTKSITRKFHFQKKHKSTIITLTVLASFAIITWMPKSQAAETMTALETKIYEVFNVNIVDQETARQELSDLYVYWFVDASIADANEFDSATPSSVLLKLKSEYDGLNLRTTPSRSGEIVSVIDKGEKFYFLGSKDTDERGITWYEVERENGDIGWVSSSIVEFIE